MTEHYVLSPGTGFLEKETEEIMAIEVEDENEDEGTSAEQSSSQSSYTPRMKKRKADSLETSFINYLEQKKVNRLFLYFCRV